MHELIEYLLAGAIALVVFAFYGTLIAWLFL